MPLIIFLALLLTNCSRDEKFDFSLRAESPSTVGIGYASMLTSSEDNQCPLF
jgi:hypothetical protein